ncbi:hypothetical protein [Pseudomonas gingeri]|uniref:hypothetical protein n=1 Tax=Pseudomonas gingeri TaxID=117681 RepID=UPI0015A2E8D3|nr:hypothetical protein [Pseudomonas gingeri]NWE25655.1 hypothetical protein [Pseudomonas gingeri]NWE99188.1 hypothetical protein [Pseudomonas gingeri]
MKLIPSSDIKKYKLEQIEDPFFVYNKVEPFLASPWRLSGLTQLLEECRVSPRDARSEYGRTQIRKKIDNADWLLVISMSPGPFKPLSEDFLGDYSFLTGKPRRRIDEFYHPPQPEEPVPPKSPKPLQATLMEPGFYIVQKTMSRKELESSLFDYRDSQVLEKFNILNQHLSESLRPGQMVILSDPRNLQCTREEALLMEAAISVDKALAQIDDDEALFLVRHHDQLHAVLSYAATGLGVGSNMFGQNLKNVEKTLVSLEDLHQRTFQQHGHLKSASFVVERKQLLMQLDNSLGPLVRKGVGIPDHPKLKSALGISSRSLVHQWNKAGATGQIPGYATHIQGAAKAAKYIRRGGWLGIGIGGVASVAKVRETCRTGRDEACLKAKFTEAGAFTGNVLGGAIAGATGGMICAALGMKPPFLDGLVCAVIVAGAGTLAMGELAQEGGEYVGESIYEWSVK